MQVVPVKQYNVLVLKSKNHVAWELQPKGLHSEFFIMEVKILEVKLLPICGEKKNQQLETWKHHFTWLDVETYF